MKLPNELEFLSPFLHSPREAYRSASWLLSGFDEPVWLISFGYKQTKQLKWSVFLDNGTRLTDLENSELLEGLKYFLTSCTRDLHGYLGETNDIQGSQAACFQRACHLIDYLLINGERYQLATYGLAGLTGGNLAEILDAIASKTTIHDSVYNWTGRLKAYCLSLVSADGDERVQTFLKANPQVAEITHEQRRDDELGIDHALIPSIRAALYLKGLYHKQMRNGNQPNTIAMSNLLYPETIWGRSQNKPTHPILCYNSGSSLFSREYPGAPVTSGTKELMRDTSFSRYSSSLYNLGVLHELNVPCPSVDALTQLLEFTPAPALAKTGRFKSLPSAAVFESLRCAIEFHLDYGEALIRDFCRIALKCRKLGISPCQLPQDEFANLLGCRLRELGVKRLFRSLKEKSTSLQMTGRKGNKQTYFASLRESCYLYDSMVVYVGAIQFTVGVLMARRSSELYKLKADSCLDEAAQWLVFDNAKSTRHLFGFRRKEARPIEPIAADMVKNLIRMQKILKRVGFIKQTQTLFSTPCMRGSATLTQCSIYSYNRNLDFFCDYIQTPINMNGERYYFRQHQLRRFFAMLFFYCGSFSKLDTLQWMLGHTDPKHVYRYITESTDGAVLVGAKSQYIAEQLHQGKNENYGDLTKLLYEKYGTKDFELIDTDVLEDQVAELVQEGWIEIEPDFFVDHQEHRFKIVVRLVRKSELV
ncbi:integrase [Stutzerimonas chloritidismutans]|uniref:integrase n=1 Tax=Stutzerimonas chloritidismutans TaxID=203192 RepID=UPI003F16B7C2